MKFFQLLVFFFLVNTVFFQESEHIYKEEVPFTKKLEFLWTGKSGNSFDYPAHIDGNMLYVVNSIDNSEGKGQVFAYNKSNGNLIWKSEKQEGLPLKDLVIDGNEIFFTTRRNIVSIDKETGKTNWTFYNPYSMMLGSSAGVFPDVVIAASADNSVFAVSRKTHELAWEIELTEIATPDLYKYKNAMIFSDDEEAVYSIDSKTGKINWAYKKETASEIVIEGNKAYLGNGGRSLVCLNLDNGQPIWSTDIKDGNPYVNGTKYFCASDFSSKPLIIGNAVCAGDYTHTVAAFDKTNGKLLWKDYYPDLNRSEIINYNGKLLLSSEIAITLLDLNGKIVEKYKIPANSVPKDMPNNVSIDPKTKYIFMTNENGQIFCVKL